MAGSNDIVEHETSQTTQPAKAGRSLKLRLRAVLVLIFVAGVLGTAAWLNPAQLEKPFHNGYSFTFMGIRPFAPCGFLYRTGYPCPTCYMTRSFAYMMHGRPDKAFLAQPFGAALCLMVIYLGWGGLKVLYTGKAWRPIWVNWSKKWLLSGVGAAFLAGWIFRLLYGMITHEFPLVR